MATQTWLWVFFFLQGRLPCNLASWGFQPPHPRPGAFLHEKGPGPKSVFKGGRTTRGTGEVRPPLKIPLCRGWLPRKIDSLQPREGIRVSGKISRLRRGEPLREIFRAYPLWRSRGTGVSPANFSPIFFRQKMGPGAGRSACIATARWNLEKALLAGGAGAGSPRRPGFQGNYPKKWYPWIKSPFPLYKVYKLFLESSSEPTKIENRQNREKMRKNPCNRPRNHVL